jgi:hypothetical protein
VQEITCVFLKVASASLYHLLTNHMHLRDMVHSRYIIGNTLYKDGDNDDDYDIIIMVIINDNANVSTYVQPSPAQVRTRSKILT